MVEFRIDVVVNPGRAKEGARQVEQSFRSINVAASRTEQLLKRVFVFSALALGVRRVVQISDTFTVLQNRIRTVTKGTQQLTGVTQELFKVSQRTRAEFRATTELYVRASLAVRELNIAQRQLLEFTESVNQAVRISGATIREANAALIQLAQGLASGALRGDELRSVLEQLPVVADVIAKQLKVTRGELRKLGSQGLLTTELILEAFKNARLELDVTFSRLIPTIGEAFIVLGNSILRVTGEFNKASGIAEFFARAIISLADSVEGMLPVLGGLVSALTAMLVAKLLIVVFAELQVLFAGVAANAIAAGGAVNFLKTTFARLAVVSGSLFSPVGIFVAAAAVLGFLATRQTAAEKAARNHAFALSELGDEARKLPDDLANLDEKLKLAIEKRLTFQLQVAKNDLAAIKRDLSEVSGFFGTAPERIALGLEGEQLDQLNAVRRELRAGILTITEFESKLFDLSRAFKSQKFTDYVDELLDSTNLVSALVKKIERLTADLKELRETGKILTVPKISGEIQKELDILDQEIALLKLGNKEREIQKGLLAAIKKAKKLEKDLLPLEVTALKLKLRLKQALTDEDKILKDIRGSTEDYGRSLEALNRLLFKGTISTEEFAKKQRELRLAVLESATDTAAGIERGLIRIQQTALDTATVAEDALVNAFTSAEDALVDFVTTGKLDFKSLVDSMIRDLARLFIRQQVTQRLLGFFGSGGGGSGIGRFFGLGGGATPGGLGSSGLVGTGFSGGGGLRGIGTLASTAGFLSAGGAAGAGFFPAGAGGTGALSLGGSASSFLSAGNATSSGFLPPGFGAAALQGIGGGLTGGGLASLFGLGNTNQAINAGASIAGGALGLALVPFIGPLGPVVGGFLASTLAGLFNTKPKIKKAISPLSFDPETGIVGTADPTVRRGGDLGRSEAGALATAELLNEVLETIGGGITGLPGRVAFFSKSKAGQREQIITEFQAGTGVGVNKIFDATPQGIQAAVADLTFQTLKAAAEFTGKTGVQTQAAIADSGLADAFGLTGVSESVLSAIQNSVAKDLAGLVSDIDFALFVEGFDELPVTITAAEQAISAINATFDESTTRAKALGISLVALEAARVREILKLTTDFNTVIETAILGITDPAQLALDQLGTAQEARLKEAEVLGADLVLLERLNGLERIRLLEQQGEAAKQSLETQGQNIQDFINKITGSTASPLGGEQTLATAERLFNEQLVLAQGGDATGLTAAASNLLEVSQQQFASSEQFFQRFNFVLSSLNSVLGNIPGFAHGGSVRIGGSGGLDSQSFAARVSPGGLITSNPRGRDSSQGQELGLLAQVMNQNAAAAADQRDEIISELRQVVGELQQVVRGQEQQSNAPRAGQKLAG